MKVLVVGSGPSGVHFALTALRKGHSVVMLDVGNAKAPAVAPDLSFQELKQHLPDPASYFIGGDYSGITLPAQRPSETKEYYGLPPSKDYVFKRTPFYEFHGDGFATLSSFAAGGLAECWTGGSYAFDDADLAQFPFDYAGIEPYYAEVAARIGVAGERDDIPFPAHANLLTPTNLDDSAARLVANYTRRRDHFKSKHGVVLGRSRQAVLTQPRGDGREACRSCGRCLWGCPNGAFYTPSITLRECLAFENFEYRPGYFASHLELGAGGEASGLRAIRVDGGREETFTAEAYVLAAGALSSSNLVLRTQYKATGDIIRLEGLMDNRQILAPFFNFGMLGRPYQPNSYQYHQLAFGMTQAAPKHYVHGQITTLKTGAAHPLLQNLPLDLKTAAGVFRTLRSGLGIANFNYADTRRAGNFLTLRDVGGDWPALAARYRPGDEDEREIRRIMKAVGRFFLDIGAPLVPGMAHIRPVGSGVHYGGTLPMSAKKREWAVSPDGASYDYPNVFAVDGATFPFMPAKNLTFTLMANATRVADQAF